MKIIIKLDRIFFTASAYFNCTTNDYIRCDW